MIHNVHVTLSPGLHGKRSIEQVGGSSHQRIGLKFKEETSEMLDWERRNIWCWSLDTSGSRSEVPGKMRNLVLEKDGVEQFDRSCEKVRRYQSRKQ